MGKWNQGSTRMVAVLIVGILIVGLFAGCTSKKADEISATAAPTGVAAAVETDPFAEHMDISIAFWAIADAFPDGVTDAVKDAFLKKLNITLKPVNTTWDDNAQKIQLWATSGQLPDIFGFDGANSPSLKKWITQGIVHELPADLSAYPLLNKMMQDPGFQAYKYPLGDANGKFFSIPHPNYSNPNFNVNTNGIIIRKDWMAKVGITKTPETMDEFIALMKAFVEKDPDGNNKNDTIGLSPASPAYLSYLMVGFQPGLMGGVSNWVRDNGKWMPAFMTDKAAQGIKAIKQLYTAGGLDKDFATMKDGQAMEKFVSGVAGAYAEATTPGTLLGIKSKYEEINPGKKFEDAFMILPGIKNVDGNFYRYYSTGMYAENYINAKVDAKKMDRILRMFEFMISEEGFNLLNYGIEGVDFTKSADGIQLIEQKDTDGKPIALDKKYPFTYAKYIADWGGSNSFNDPTKPLGLRKMSKDRYEWSMANAKPVDTDLRLNFIDYPLKAKAIVDFRSDLVKVILSKDSDKVWNEVTEKYIANGFDKIVEEFNAKTKELGIYP